MDPWSILCVDDDPSALELLKTALESLGARDIHYSSNSEEALSLLGKQDIDLVLLDIFMPGMRGDILLPRIKEKYPSISVVMTTGFNDAPTAVKCLQDGASGYLVKPLEPKAFRKCLGETTNQMNQDRAKQNSQSLCSFSESLSSPEAFDGLVAISPAMQSLFKFIESQAKTGKPLLLSGKAGTGKRSLAHVSHRLKGLYGRPLEINPKQAEEIFFSQSPMTFLKENHPNFSESLYLPGFSDYSWPLQEKVLKISESEKGHLQLILSTELRPQDNLFLKSISAQVYDKLKEGHVEIPTLNQRREDIPEIFDYLMRRECEIKKINKPKLTQDHKEILKNCIFKNNVNELQDKVRDLLENLKQSEFSKELLYYHFENCIDESYKSVVLAQGGICFSKFPSLKEANESLVLEAMSRSKGVQRKAAQLLNIPPSSMFNHVKRLKDHDANL